MDKIIGTICTKNSHNRINATSFKNWIFYFHKSNGMHLALLKIAFFNSMSSGSIAIFNFSYRLFSPLTSFSLRDKIDCVCKTFRISHCKKELTKWLLDIFLKQSPSNFNGWPLFTSIFFSKFNDKYPQIKV